MIYQVVEQKEYPGNYLETSGSAMIAYALMKGARLGVLDRALGEEGSRILDGIRDTYLKKGRGWISFTWNLRQCRTGKRTGSS